MEPIHEGDIVYLFCRDAKGFIYAQSPCSSYSHVTVYQVPNAEGESKVLKDPALPNIHFASFKVLSENVSQDSNSPLGRGGSNDHGQEFNRSLVYGRKIKLLHIASKKYISISANTAATLVDEFDKRTCLFRILPTRTGKSRGEDVYSQDQIKLESVSEKGHHILCSSNTLTSRYELKMAVTDSVFIISSLTKLHNKLRRKALKGCDVVMLFHNKRESYLAGSCSIATDVLPAEIKDNTASAVGARKRETMHGLQKLPPLSGDCFWQIERAKSPLNSDQLEFGDECRIKHIPSQQYLAVVQKGSFTELTLKNIKPGQPIDAEITFSLVSATGKTGGILKHSYVEIRHIQTGKNLSVQNKSFLQRTSTLMEQSINTEMVLQTVQKKWFRLGLEDSSEARDQYFHIEEINIDLIHEYYHISGVTAVLTEYMKKFNGRSSSNSLPALEEPIEVLQEFSKWLVLDESHVKRRANMFRIAKGIDLLVGFLYMAGEYQENEITVEMCKKISLVLLRYVEMSNKKSNVYLAEKRFMDVMFSKIGCGIDVEKVLSSLAKSESAITKKVVSRLTGNREFLEHVFRSLKNLDSSILDFLSSLCFSGGKPSKKMQNTIRAKIIEDGERFFIKTIINKGVVEFIYPDVIKGPITNICSKETGSIQNKTFTFFVAQLKLFSHICKGVNLESADLIIEKGLVTFEEALICINDNNIHPLVQSAYLDFVTSAYVDFNVEESGIDIDNIWHTYIWGRICPTEAAGVADTFSIIPNAKEIKDLQSTIRKFLRQNKTLYAKEEYEGQNELIAEMLSVIEPLVSYGFYIRDEEILEIIGILIGLVDGVSDRPGKSIEPKKVVRYQQKGRYEATEDNKKIFEIKSRALHVLHLLYKWLTYTTLGKLLYDFKYLREDLTIGPDDDYSPISSSLEVLLDEDLDTHCDDMHILSEILHNRLQFLFTQASYGDFQINTRSGDSRSLVNILLDLLDYDNDSLRLKSVMLLFNIYLKEEVLLYDAALSYIVTPPSIRAFGLMVRLGCFSDEDKILLRMIQGTAAKESLCEKTKTALHLIGNACIINNDETLPHACNQFIAFSSSVFSALVTYILQYCVSDQIEQQPILHIACKVLTRIIKNNSQIQSKLFRNFTDFFEAKVAVHSVAALLTETISGNPDLCRKITETEIRSLCAIASSSTPEHYEYFTTLEAIMKPNKSSSETNIIHRVYQDLIAQTFTENRHEYFDIMFQDKHAKRLSILKVVEDDDGRLLQLLAVSDLLATCAEGESKYSENIGQSIFTIEELIAIVVDSDVEISRKKPFVRLLNWVYLTTEKDSLVSISSLSNSDQFWDHLEKCSILMNILHENMSQGIIDVDNIKMKNKLLFDKHFSFTSWKETTADGIVLLFNDKEILVSSFLYYLLDGLIPLITSFCQRLSSNISSGLASKLSSNFLTPKVVSVLKSISDSIANLLKFHPMVFLTTQAQLNYWNQCMDGLVFMLPQFETENLNLVRLSVSVVQEDNSALTAYNDTLAEEIEINEDFQTFVRNMKMIIEGQKCLSTKTNVFGDDGVDLVPPGKSFQVLVKLFIENAFEGQVIDNSSKINSLLKMLDILYRKFQQPLTTNEIIEYDYVLLTVLQILCGVVYFKLDKINLALQQDNPDKFESEYFTNVKPLQDSLIKLKSHVKVMQHFSHPNNEIAMQVLDFLRVLLFWGNEQSQLSIGLITKYRDTKFFVRFNTLLQSVITTFSQPFSKSSRFQRTASEMPHLLSRFDSNVTEPPSDADVEENVKPVLTRFHTLTSVDDNEEVTNVQESQEETDFGGNEKRTVRSYLVTGSEQVEASESDATKCASVVLDVVAWMCDGQNKQLQDILRKQDTAFQNVNVVGEVAVLLQALAEQYNEKNICLVQKAIQALIEMCAGNFTNQEVAFKGQIVDSVNIILQRNSFNNPSIEMGDTLKLSSSAVELLEVLIEETNQNSKFLVKGISQDLNVDVVMTTIRDFYEMSNDSSQPTEAEEAKKGLFKAYHVLKKIADYLHMSLDRYVNFEEEYGHDTYWISLWKYASDHSRGIEINYTTQNQEEILTKIYFPFDPSKILPEEQKAIIRQKIRRDSPEDKVKDLLNWMESVRKNVKYRNFVKKKWYLKWALLASGFRIFLLALLTLLLNAFVIFLFEVPFEDRVYANTSEIGANASISVILNPLIPFWFGFILIYILGFFHIILAVWMCIEYFIKEAPNLLFKLPYLSLFLYKLKQWLERYERIRRFLFLINRLFCNGKIREFKKPEKSKCFEVHILSFPPIYRIFFVLFAIAALGTHGYFYCGCIIYVFLKNEVLLQILTAVKRSAYQLLSLFLLGIAVLLIYAVVYFFLFHNFFNPYTETSTFCNSLIECYVSVTREGLLDTLGTMIPVRYVGQQDPSFFIYWFRTIFDISFFIIVTVLGLNIVVAIIVDRFSELRSERDAIKKDELNYCFVCGIDNDTFERKAKGFYDHVHNDHSLWNYIYFVLHLDSLYTNDHNALEKYVYDSIKKRKINFFPLRKAKVLGGKVSSLSDQHSF